MKYMTFYMNAINLAAYVTGTAQPKMNQARMNSILIAIPPLAEQHRIVAKLEELQPDIDAYDKAQTKLQAIEQRFPDDMKKSLLQYAIEGKLVSQRKEEGTAKDLLAEIRAEKARLVKEKKIKKSKPLPAITDDEKPFDIPDSWEWVRLGDILLKLTDGTHHSPISFPYAEYMYVTAKNIKEWGVDTSNITYVDKPTHDAIYSRCNPEKGDILLIKDGATTGVVTINNLDTPFSLLSSVALLKQTRLVCAPFIVYMLRSNLLYKSIRGEMKGTGITRITLKQIAPIVIPLPPLAEQQRIVAKLEELLPLCDQLAHQS